MEKYTSYSQINIRIASYNCCHFSAELFKTFGGGGGGGGGVGGRKHVHIGEGNCCTGTHLVC